MDLGKKILSLRKKNGLSQEELGERINVTRQTISNWELGVTSPNTEQLKSLSKEFNISIDELLDNDIKDVLVEKVSNTEKLAGLILKIIKIVLISVPVLFVLIIIASILFKNIRATNVGNRIEETIVCSLYGEEHSFTISYEELTGIPREMGGDSYFDDILNLDQYNNAHQMFNVINDYVKKNGGTCVMINDNDQDNVISMYVKEETLTPEGATFVIETDYDFSFEFGEPFYLEKYNYKDNRWEKLPTNEGCAFILPAYGLKKGEPYELNQNWSCMYGSLEKGQYKIVKNFMAAGFEFDVSTEFSID